MTTRERLEEENGRCVRLCHEHGHLSPGGNPNVFLLYSSPETFEPPTAIMWLGKNPGGGPEEGDIHRADLPFQLALAPGWSAYLDLQWAGHPVGRHPMQRAVLESAALFAGSDGAERLLARCPGDPHS